MEEYENYEETSRIRPLLTTEERQHDCERLAYNLAREKLASGTAKDALIIHFLRLSTAKTKLEEKKLEADTQLSLAKIEAASAAAIEAERTDLILRQLKKYQGSLYSGDDDSYEDYNAFE